jgi:hypothetical protein
VTAWHPDFAGNDRGDVYLTADVDEPVSIDLVMLAGCVIRGQVVDAAGNPAGDGVVMRRTGLDAEEAVTPVEDDGSFELATVDAEEVTLRAWPWHSPPPPYQTFACHDGARFDAVFTVHDEVPDLDGTIVDASGAPVPGAYVDAVPFGDDGSYVQQQRARDDGGWAFHELPPGDYIVNAYLPDRGMVEARVEVPARGLRLQLGGTGTLTGSVRGIVDGSFALTITACRALVPADVSAGSDLPSRRVVDVRAGRYRVEVPACTLAGNARHGRRFEPVAARVVAGAVTTLDLDLRPPDLITITGRVTDGSRPLAEVDVSGEHTEDVGEPSDELERSATTDGDGTFTITLLQGDQLVLSASGYLTQRRRATSDATRLDVAMLPGDDLDDDGKDDEDDDEAGVSAD